MFSAWGNAGFRTAVRIWFLASLGKYVPGKVWAVAGAAVLAQRAGVDPSVAVAGALVLQALAIASGAAAVALTAREAFQAGGPGMAAAWRQRCSFYPSPVWLHWPRSRSWTG